MILKIHLQQIKTLALIGTYKHERVNKQPIILDLTLVPKASPSSLHDQIDHAVDYSVVYQQIIQWIDESNFKLLESLAHFLACNLLEGFALKSVFIRIYKPHALKDLAEVSIEYFKEA